MTAKIIPFPTRVGASDALDRFIERMEDWKRRPVTAADYSPDRLPADWSREERRTYEMLTWDGYQTHERAFNHVAALHAVGHQLPGEDYSDWLGRRARAVIEEVERSQR